MVSTPADRDAIESVPQTLTRLGGSASRAALIAVTSRAAVDAALAAGELIVTGRTYASPDLAEMRHAALRVSGALSFRSAAQHHGWAVKHVPDQPDVTVPANRRLSAARRRTVTLHRGDLHPSEVSEGVTTKLRTLTDCLRGLPFDEALAIADSALRDGFSPRFLIGIAAGARGPGSAQMRRVAALADARAENPFESAARAIAVDVPGLSVRPQVWIRESGFLGRPDLVDERLRIVIECDSFAWHGDRAALTRDCRRYDLLVVHGWLVLRFSWEQIMFEPDWVREMLAAAVGERSDQVCQHCRHA